jgi:hypothetical protein
MAFFDQKIYVNYFSLFFTHTFVFVLARWGHCHQHSDKSHRLVHRSAQTDRIAPKFSPICAGPLQLPLEANPIDVPSSLLVLSLRNL